VESVNGFHLDFFKVLLTAGEWEKNSLN